uniref:50S ribosomal protein L22 n=1 Tax=uncultured Chloroflexi bacterium Rifle_16ft_4_minimus_13751 TaxID=1665056 RepID=A0A0H4T0E0_9CHLR|nr:50S ribosomal protein L22, large subunit ribosomal protein L22 [uncultured Chloroflexi bacterium Rifle_16ft_4_minimus_13751]
MAEDIRAHARYVPHPPQKVRLVIDLVRGRGVTEALDLLRFLPNGASRPVAKMLASAMSNAEENFADEAPTRRWRRFGARGRFKPILRRASHVTVFLREREGT